MDTYGVGSVVVICEEIHEEPLDWLERIASFISNVGNGNDDALKYEHGLETSMRKESEAH